VEKVVKNKNIIIVITVVLVLVCGILYFFTDIGRPVFKEIGLSKLSEMMEEDETFIIFIGSSICSACEEFTPTLKRAVDEYDITVHYIDVNKLDGDEKQELLDLIDYRSATPKVYFIEDGEYSSLNMINGNRSYKDVVDRLEKNGYKKR